MGGTYAQDNLSHEQPLLRNIFEASIAYALDHNSKWWIQAGVFPSHLGFESAVSTENLAYTRTLAAENSPYYLSGIKLIHHFSEQWSISLLALNGWQQISRPFNDQNIALGSQLQYQQGNGFTFNWSTYLASKHPVNNTEGRERFFNNIYMIWPVSDVFDIIGGFDIGLQKSDRSDVDWQHWYSPVFIGSYKMNSKLSATFRLEFYDDPHLSEISPPGPASDGFGLISGSVGVNILLLAQLMLRMEYRCFASSDTPYYNYTSNHFTSFNSFFISGLAFILP